jgi:hypothetical protein
MSDLTDQQIRNGINRCREFDEFFTLPKFRALCVTPDLAAHGLPPARQAYEEACLKPAPKAKQRWSHPAVYQAGVATGWFDLASLPSDQIYPVFEYNYAQLCQRVVAGEDITVPVPQALPEKVNAPLTHEQKLSRIDELKGLVGLKTEAA